MTVTYNIPTNEFSPIHSGLQAFYLAVDGRELQPGVKLFFREYDGRALTGRSIECTITSVLRRKDSKMIMPDACVIGFHTEGRDQEEVVSRTQLANLLDRAKENVSTPSRKSQYYRHPRFSEKPRFTQ